ncbi:DUF1351 domain-containing protein, partial [Staphylococcus haemolyticus]|uniref:DUF1351 domain-containing protein n=1 Tax=Staphylococcus haemolyticus TaxID=1283 RepID=UPI000BD0E325
KKKVTEGIADVMGYIKKQHDDLKTGISTITKYAQAYQIDPAGWIDQLKQGQDVNYLLQAIDNQVKLNQEAEQRKQAQQATEQANEIKQGNKTVNKTTGEVISRDVTLTISATVPQMNRLKQFMDSNGIIYRRVGK